MESARMKEKEDTLALAELAASPLALVSWELDKGRGRLVQWNGAAQKLFGWSAAEVLGRDPLEFLFPQGEHKRLAALLGLKGEKPPQKSFESEAMTKGGRTVFLRWHNSPPEGKGAPVRVFLLGEVSREGRGSKNFPTPKGGELDLLFQRSLDLLCLVDREGRLKRVNSRWEKELGYREEELLETPFIDYIDAEDKDATLSAMGRLLSQEESLFFANRVRTREGSFRYLEWTGFPFGKLFYYAARDVTERKTFQEELKKRLFALTSPWEELEHLELGEILDMKEVQEIQDSFSEATGVASVILDTKGRFLTKPSRFCRLCKEIVRTRKKGRENCTSSDIFLSQQGATLENLRPCLSAGLLDVGTPICVGEHTIAYWFVGQVLDEKADKAKMVAYAEEIGADPREFAEALEEVPRMDREQFLKVVNALYTMARQLSLLALQNFQQGRMISEKSEAERKLREAGEFLENLFQNAKGPILVWDPNFRVTHVNRAFEELVGLEAREVVGRKVESLFPDQERERYTALVLKAQAGERWEGIDIPTFGEGGASRKILWNSSNLRDQEGRLQATIGMGFDITERVEIERLLRESEARFQSLYSHMEEGVAFHTLLRDEGGRPCDYVIREVNRSYERILGLSKEEIEGKRATEAYGVGEAPFLENYVSVALTGKPQQMEAFFSPMGKTFAISAAPWGEEGFATIFSDITARRSIERERENLLKELAEKNKDLERILYVSSHDLRSPLVNIQGFGRRMEKDLLELKRLFSEGERGAEGFPPLEERMVKALGYIRAGGEKMETLIGGLLRLSRVGRTPPVLGKVDLQKLVGAVVSSMKYQIEEAGAEVVVGELPEVWGDSGGISQVLANLVDNAIKYRDSQRALRIIITGKGGEGKALLCVEDNGRGIAGEQREKIWEPFTRLVSNDETPGEGLGLALARKIVESNRGRIWAESREGEGSRFWIELPWEEPKRAKEEE